MQETVDPKNLPDYCLCKRRVYDNWAFPLKRALYAYCCGEKEKEIIEFNEEYIIPSYLPVWRAFEACQFNFFVFMEEEFYSKIVDEELRIEVIMGVCFPIIHHPLTPFVTDYFNGHFDIFKRKAKNLSDTDILRLLFLLCSSERDLWWVIAKLGIGDVTGLYNVYTGISDNYIKDATGIPCHYEKNSEKASKFLKYLLSSTTGSTETVRAEATRLQKMVEIIRG